MNFPVHLLNPLQANVDEKKGIVQIEYIDTSDRTPILNLKPYIPASDRVKNVQVPEWFTKWPQLWEKVEEFISKFFCEDLSK